MNNRDLEIQIKLQEAHERYIQQILSLIQKKMNLIIAFRTRIGEKKIKILKERLQPDVS